MNLKRMTEIMMLQMERLNNPNCDLEQEVQRSEALAKTAAQIVKSGELIVKAAEVSGQTQFVKETLLIENQD